MCINLLRLKEWILNNCEQITDAGFLYDDTRTISRVTEKGRLVNLKGNMFY